MSLEDEKLYRQFKKIDSYVFGGSEVKKELIKAPIVCDYLDVFRDNLFCLPPD